MQKDDNNGILVSLEMKRCLEVAASFVTLIYNCSFVLIICLHVFLYILSKVIDEAKCEEESVLPPLTECPPPPESGRQCASVPRLRLINGLISAGLSVLLSHSDRNKMQLLYILFLYFFN